MKTKIVFTALLLVSVLTGCSSKLFEPLPEVRLIQYSSQKIVLQNEVSWNKESWVLPAGDYKLVAESDEGKFYQFTKGSIYRGDWLMKGQPWQGGVYVHNNKETPPNGKRKSEKFYSPEGLYTWVVGQDFTGVTGFGTYTVSGGDFLVMMPIPKENQSEIDLSDK